jgi:hypothetical protein
MNILSPDMLYDYDYSIKVINGQKKTYLTVNILFKKYVVYSQPNALAPSTAASLPLSVDTRSLALPL